MSDVQIQPLRSYQDGGKIRTAKGGPYVVPLRHAKQLEGRGLCQILDEQQTPKSGAGEQSSASPAAPASAPQTANLSGPGARRPGRPKKGAAASA